MIWSFPIINQNNNHIHKHNSSFLKTYKIITTSASYWTGKIWLHWYLTILLNVKISNILMCSFMGLKDIKAIRKFRNNINNTCTMKKWGRRRIWADLVVGDGLNFLFKVYLPNYNNKIQTIIFNMHWK
jgi:hypothetical protein